ncbi:MAG: TRAP transporter substrate-binding protein [Gammaproteobacteria bacterium]|nr:TRAP transporter substrate-binding protein [Gammaproteobacteria bacterium]MDE0157349.1 TRAP transporter substrate-binding protein [Gammaproteobacteria bacterium]
MPPLQRTGLTVLLLASISTLGAGCAESTDKDLKVRVTSLGIPDTPWHDFWLRFATTLEERDAAEEIDLDLFISGELGSEETALANLRRGRVQIGGFALQGVATLIPELNVLLAPYLFDSREEAAFVMDNYLSDAYSKLFAEKGLKLIQWSEVGWFYVYGKQPLLTPDATRGISMRSSNALGSRYFAEAIGADLIPLSFAEVIPALQTNLIESGQTGVGMYTLAGIAKAAPHLVLTRHAFDMGPILANKVWYDGLPERFRRLIFDSIESAEVNRTLIRAALDNYFRNSLPAMDVTVHELSEQQQAQWRTVALPTHQLLLRDTGGQAEHIYALVQRGKAEFSIRKGVSRLDSRLRGNGGLQGEL